MATGSITKRTVDAIKAGPDTAFLWDDDLSGFGLRITTNGVRSYVYQYRLGGREAPKKRVTIGRHGSPWTPDTARKEAKRLAHLVGQGTDPVQAEKTRRRESVTLAFKPYAERFVEDYLKSEWPKSWEVGEGLLRRDAVAAFAGLALPQITRANVADLLDKMRDRPGARRNMFAVLRRLFRWAVSRGDIAVSPIVEMDPPAATAARERVLTDTELATIWEAAGNLGYPFGPMFRLLLATGQRREEVAGIAWGELDRASGTWTIPAGRAKNKRAHIVPLPPIAVAVMDDHVRSLSDAADDEKIEWPNRGLVFTVTGKTSVSGYSKAKLRLDSEILRVRATVAQTQGVAVETIEPWRIHDLRRTVATGLQRLGVRFEVTEAVLNHVSGAKGGVAGVYQRHDWKEEKRTALDAWGRHVAATIEPSTCASNVVPLAKLAAA